MRQSALFLLFVVTFCNSSHAASTESIAVESVDGISIYCHDEGLKEWVTTNALAGTQDEIYSKLTDLYAQRHNVQISFFVLSDRHSFPLPIRGSEADLAPFFSEASSLDPESFWQVYSVIHLCEFNKHEFDTEAAKFRFFQELAKMRFDTHPECVPAWDEYFKLIEKPRLTPGAVTNSARKKCFEGCGSTRKDGSPKAHRRLAF